MEMIDIQNMLDALAHSENLSDIPGMQKMKADQSHHDAVHEAPALDPQGEEQFRQWLAARDGEAEDLSVLRSVFVMFFCVCSTRSIFASTVSLRNMEGSCGRYARPSLERLCIGSFVMFWPSITTDPPSAFMKPTIM